MDRPNLGAVGQAGPSTGSGSVEVAGEGIPPSLRRVGEPRVGAETDRDRRRSDPP